MMKSRTGRRVRWTALLIGAFALVVFATHNSAQGAKLAAGDVAPEFTLGDQNGKMHSLSDYRGRWLVLYFYPKDDTPGCTTEACRFRDEYKVYLQRGVDVLGVSIDNRESHERFARKYHLPFTLLADTDGAVARQYGAYWSFWPLRFARRYTFLIDPEGRIARAYYKVSPKQHSAQVLADLETLQKKGQTAQ